MPKSKEKMQKTLSDDEWSELVARLKVTEEQLKCMRVIVFGDSKIKKRATPAKQMRKEALTLELAEYLGPNFLNYR